jgi:hypothetical protein
LKNEVLAVILALLVVGCLGVGYLSGIGNRQTTTIVSTTTETIPTTIISTTISSQGNLGETGCTTPVSQPPAGSNLTNVYILSVPSEAVICVAYTYYGSGNATHSAEFFSSSQPCWCSDCPSACAGINGSASPSFISYDGLTNSTVTYRISTSAGLAKGTYWLIVGYWEFEALVVGPTPENVSVYHTPPFSATTAPYSTPPTTLVVGVTNITVAQVPCVQAFLAVGCGGQGRASD